MTIFDMNIVQLGIGLLLLILANVALGSIAALIGHTWDWQKFLNGAIKGGIVIAVILAVYIAGYLNPDLLVIEAGEEKVNFMTAVYLVLLAAFTVYAVDVLRKLKNILTFTVPGSAEYNNIIIKEENDNEKRN